MGNFYVEFLVPAVVGAVLMYFAKPYLDSLVKALVDKVKDMME